MKYNLKISAERPEELLSLLNSDNLSSALQEIQLRVFRPARKHGYSNKYISNILNALGDDGASLVEALEEEFIQILTERNLLDHL